MPTPPLLQQALAEALTAMQAHPSHELNWRYRQAIYQAFGDYEESEVRKARNWLAILSAQKVLPIFTTLVPYNRMPLLLLSTALEMFLEEGNLETALQVHDWGYHAFGNIVAWDPFSKRFFTNAEYAGFASYKALGEVLGNANPFSGLEYFSRSKDGTVGTYGKREIDENWIAGDQFTDVDIAHLAAVGDTAGTAAVGYACSPDSAVCDPTRLKEFWEWWLNEAIPLSWRYVTDYLGWW